MCQYIDFNEGSCSISKERCPFVYYCTRIMAYKPSASFPEYCGVRDSLINPKGYYKVEFERHGNLYIKVDGFIEIVKNPYTFIPNYVKMTKLKSGKWKIKESI